MSKRFGKKRVADCECTYTFTCGPCLRAAGPTVETGYPHDYGQYCKCADCVGEPTCDLCGRAQDDSPAGFADADWNGETGNHETCEQWDSLRSVAGSAYRLASDNGG